MNDTKSKYLFLIVELVIGILLLVNPFGFTKTIVQLAGVLFILLSIYGGYQYYKNRSYFIGIPSLIGLFIGLFLFFNPSFVIASMSIMIMIYGLYMCVGAFSKIGWAMDLRRNGYSWMMMFLSGVLNIMIALIVIVNPFNTTMVLMKFIGLSLIIETIISMIGVYLSNN